MLVLTSNTFVDIFVQSNTSIVPLLLSISEQLTTDAFISQVFINVVTVNTFMVPNPTSKVLVTTSWASEF